ncbi:MAG: C_GCAxxG_C_C family protein [Desulfobacterium sp.]|nr:C_GCAxxG_C_C family protein [Desulfobacterium sp.]
MNVLHRRSFLKGLAAFPGAALCGILGAKNASASIATPETVEAPALPWGYKELDPEYLRKLGHLGYYAFECGGGAFWAMMTALKEAMGYPYTVIPLPTRKAVINHLKNKKSGMHLQVMMQFGVGGVANFGSLCGAPNGASSAINIALPMGDVKEVVPRLMRYYETTPFPSDKANETALKKAFYPPKYKSDKSLPQSASHSVLCHVSVGGWCEKAGYASGSKERSERCARLTGDISAMGGILLNAHMKGELHTVFPMKVSQETAGCRTCHSKGKKYESGQFTRGMMECGNCHDDMRPHLGENKLKTVYGADIGKWSGAAAMGTAAGLGAHAVSKRFGKGETDNDE